MEAFAVRDLTFAYPAQGAPALDHITFSLESGQFVALVGPSGCGKSTLLRQLKSALAPHGERTGEILFEGRALGDVSLREQSARIGFVQQDPDSQIVTDKVWHELAFGLESLGLDTPTIRARVAEMASFFGIERWFYREVASLSGGQKQLLNLAAVMAMQPSVLILDEPTSQLDPIAAADFLATVGRIHREFGTTVLITEHRLGEVFPLCDRVLVLERGRLICDGSPQQVGLQLRQSSHAMFLAMPVPMQVYAATDSALDCPVTVRDGRVWLERYCETHPLRPLPPAPNPVAGEPVIDGRDLWFRYEKGGPDVLRGLNLTVGRGEFLAILGGNGAGKSTTLSLLTGQNRPYRGKLRTTGTLSALPQNPQALFVKKTVREDLLEAMPSGGADPEERLAETVRLCQLEPLLARHPYDLSGGEQQRAALAKVLLRQPDILLLDEPTKGLDAAFKLQFAAMLRTLLARGVTVVMVSHDVEFCAAHAHRCALFFDGSIVSSAPPRAFFSGHCFYTTAANRMARQLLPEAVTADDLIFACGGEPPAPEPDTPSGPRIPGGPAAAPAPDASASAASPGSPAAAPKSGSPTVDAELALPLWRRLLAAVSGALVLLAFAHAIGLLSLDALFVSDGVLYGVLFGALTALAAAVSRRSSEPARPTGRQRLPRRTLAASVSIVLLIPLTVFLGMRGFGDRKYYLISLLVMLECMLPFFLVFEGRRPQARELVILAVLCALGVAGRAVMAMLPQCKPVIALVILSGVAFGGESGFLVGAVTMLTSNMLFGQGPWTPWQMFAVGLIGFLAGVLYRRGLLRRSRLSLAVFGAVSALVIFGGIMNPASAMMAQQTINWGVLLTYYLSGLPMDLVQAASTALFLWFFAQPMLEKLDRVKVKYGLMETE